MRARLWNWSSTILAYRVVEDTKRSFRIPTGFTPWVGTRRPVSKKTEVDVFLANGDILTRKASELCWKQDVESHSNIIAYKIVSNITP
jgi:hypothetical protein